ncbi:MAG: DUF503 domain-containing protein [Deltaproteobacteria bacterium]|nr:DUF503 domain-containing protein [Deltaproteobacteria bacterium]
MVVGTGIIDIFVKGSRSLKEKRAILRRILGRTKSEFNVSIAEVGEYNDWKRCRIGFSMVGNERRFINSKMDKLVNFVEGLNLADIVNVDTEIYNVSDVWNSRGEDGLDEF